MTSRRFFRAAEKPHQRASRRVDADAVAYVVDQPAQPRQILHSQQPLLTVLETRDYLRLPSVWAVYHLVYRQGLPVRRVGRSLRFDQGELEQWTRRQRQDERERPALVILKGA